MNATKPTLFREQLKRALEHWHDTLWLEQHSPFAAPYFIGVATARGERLQRLLQMAADRLCAERDNPDGELGKLLHLKYFDPQQIQEPHQHEAIASQMGLGRATYFRYLDRALDQLGQQLLDLACPSLKIDIPKARPLIGREAALQDCHTHLKAGHTLQIIGPSGLGKTLLAAHVAQRWAAPVFWYGLQRGLNDHLQQFVFALAFFLHQANASTLWMYVSSHPDQLDMALVQGMLLQAFNEIALNAPLLCIDDAQILLPVDDLRGNPELAQLLSFVEWLATCDRRGVPLLLVGQKLVLEPQHAPIELRRFDADESLALLYRRDLSVAQDDLARVHQFTRGNPMLLQLFVALHQRGEAITETLQRISAPISLDWMLARLMKHLTAKEQAILRQIAIFGTTAPHELWATQEKIIDGLIKLDLLQTGQGTLQMHAALREVIGQWIAPDQKKQLHLWAAERCAERGQHTLAAYHYVHGQQPAMALWSWHTHQANELKAGQGSAALALFSSISTDQLPNERDRKLHALLVADLCRRMGRAQDGIDALNLSPWSANTPTHARAQELRGDFLGMQGRIEAALEAYRASLESLYTDRHRVSKLHVACGRLLLVRNRDLAQAEREALQASFTAAILRGELCDEQGNLESARDHFQSAMSLAQSSGLGDLQLAKGHEALGLLEGRAGNIDLAAQHLAQSSQHYSDIGHIMNAHACQANLAYIYLLGHRYADAIAPGEKALAFFEPMRQPYWLSITAANLAEAHAWLHQLDQAEHYVMMAMREEEPTVQPYCLYVLGYIRRMQGHFEQAEAYGRHAVQAAQDARDVWALQRAQHELEETQTAMQATKTSPVFRTCDV